MNNGVRKRRPRATPVEEDTGIHRIQAVTSADPEHRTKVLEELAIALAAEQSKLGGGGGGGGGKPPSAKAKATHAAIVALVAALFGSGGVFATVYLADGRSKDNEMNIERQQVQIEAVDLNVETVDRKVDILTLKQAAIADGIEQLKSENINRLKDQANELRKENRRLRGRK